MQWEYSHMLAVMQRGLIWASQKGGPCTHVVASLTLLRLENPVKARKCNGRRAHIYGPAGYMGSHSRTPIRVGHLLCFLSVQFGYFCWVQRGSSFSKGDLHQSAQYQPEKNHRYFRFVFLKTFCCLCFFF